MRYKWWWNNKGHNSITYQNSMTLSTNMLGVLSYTCISCYITILNLTKHTMQSDREYAIYLSLYSQLYHPDYRIIRISCLFWHSQCCRQSIHSLINKKTYMYMDKRTLMTIKKTAYNGYNGYIHTCDIITLYKLTYHDIWLDILICLKIITVLIYNCIYIRLLPSTKDTYMKMYCGFYIICFKRNRCRNFKISSR